RAGEGLEHRDALFEKNVVIGMHVAQPFHHPAHRRPLGCRISQLFHIEVVYDLPDFFDRGSPETEALSQRFETAQRSLMAELALVHVEWHIRVCRVIDERERRTWVDVPADQPGGRHAIDTGPGAGHPSAVAEVGNT